MSHAWCSGSLAEAEGAEEAAACVAIALKGEGEDKKPRETEKAEINWRREGMVEEGRSRGGGQGWEVKVRVRGWEGVACVWGV